MTRFKPGDTAFLVKQIGHRKTFTAVVIYSISKKHGIVRVHGSDAKYKMDDGRKMGVPTWAPGEWIEPISPGLMNEIRESANLQE